MIFWRRDFSRRKNPHVAHSVHSIYGLIFALSGIIDISGNILKQSRQSSQEKSLETESELLLKDPLDSPYSVNLRTFSVNIVFPWDLNQRGYRTSVLIFFFFFDRIYLITISKIVTLGVTRGFSLGRLCLTVSIQSRLLVQASQNTWSMFQRGFVPDQWLAGVKDLISGFFLWVKVRF